ncbi:predicted protein [Histoplasma capsulatum G186AR]|uniref:Uncharacterized protein n=1 Tax=Ajellomyces capsulatus (strain G186AR / H82 / ATCC MYA-2454 / RMSCC 2432) TaxID=447093 RepID=C0P0J6_AJECG|nr:uncharacterized protein HCBG_08926 [Histoplasma capsulatum G186AR]EEH02816.1 predicted protein [Histoplasma capsulatum G186AR]
MQLCEINQVEDISCLYVVKMILIRLCKETLEAFRVVIASRVSISRIPFPSSIMISAVTEFRVPSSMISFSVYPWPIYSKTKSMNWASDMSALTSRSYVVSCPVRAAAVEAKSCINIEK